MQVGNLQRTHSVDSSQLDEMLDAIWTSPFIGEKSYIKKDDLKKVTANSFAS